MAHGLFEDRGELEALFAELAVELNERGLHADVVMVGGAWMLWYGGRASTHDIDSARRFEADLEEVIGRIARRHELGARWLNDAAAMFWPAGVSYETCTTVFESEAMVVRTPTAETIFVMKLYRADPQDREDLVTLWPSCHFDGPTEAADAFRAAYPHAPDDPYLADYIADVAADARSDS